MATPGKEPCSVTREVCATNLYEREEGRSNTTVFYSDCCVIAIYVKSKARFYSDIIPYTCPYCRFFTFFHVYAYTDIYTYSSIQVVLLSVCLLLLLLVFLLLPQLLFVLLFLHVLLLLRLLLFRLRPYLRVLIFLRPYYSYFYCYV